MNIYKKLGVSFLCCSIATLAGGVVSLAKADVIPATEEDLSGEYANAYEAAGYEVTFTYQDDDPAIEKVELFSQSGFQFFKQLEVGNYIITGVNQANIYSAYEFEDGMYPCAGTTCYYEMEKWNDGTYSVTLPLPATQYLYKYKITYTESDGRGEVIIVDPDNPAETNGDSDSGWSKIYVGDADHALTGMEYIYPREDGQTGTVTYVEYEALDGSTQPLGIYLPYNYDSSKTYKTVYLSHGAGGNETEWLSIGSIPNIMDNLCAEGKLEDTIVVTMDNLIWYIPDVPFISGWDWEKMKDNLLNCIVPYMEENYNASPDPDDRAICGLSMGSIGASSVVQQWPDSFGYYGCFSAANNGIDVSTWDVDAMKEKTIFVSAGMLDMALMNGNYDNPENDNTSRNFSEHLTEAEIPHTFITFPGMHDWNVWVASFTCFAKDILWK